MKTFAFIAVLAVHFVMYSISVGSELPAYEIQVKNRSVHNKTVYLYLHPVSFVFNADVENGYRYDLRARRPNPGIYNFLNGRNLSDDTITIPPNTDAYINFDRDHLISNTRASVGYGVYKFTMITDTLVDTFSVEWDAAFPYRPEGTPWTSDLELLFTDTGTPNILFKWSGDSLWHELFEVGRKIVAWDQQYSDSGFRRSRQKDYGNFRYDTVRSLTLNVFPLDSRKDCGVENHTFHDNRSGTLTSNLLIDKDIHTRDTLIDLPTNIVIADGAALKINNSKILEIISPSNSGTNAYNNLIVQDSSFLILYGYSKIILHQPNKLTLQHGSNLTLGNNSEIIIQEWRKVL